MRLLRFSLFTVVGMALLAAAAAVATASSVQEREVVSSEVAVSGDEAELLLEFADGGVLAIQFIDGQVTLDGVSVGEYTPGGPLDMSWRALLGSAIALRGEALVQALVDWSPPESLSGDGAIAAERVDLALEESLTFQAQEASAPQGTAVDASPADRDVTVDVGTLVGLLTQRTRLAAVTQALSGLEEGNLRVSLGEDLVIGEDDVVEGNVLVVGGDLEVYGTVLGDAVVIDGSVQLRDAGRIAGDLQLADARLFRDGGVVEGRIQTLEMGAEEEAISEALSTREQLREELRAEIRDAVRGSDRGRSFWSAFDNIGEGIAGLFQNLITFVLLSLMGLGVMYFFPDRLDVVADTIRVAPTRSAAVGFASGFLLLPVYVLGVVVLAVSIVGIPVLLAWVPLFPIVSGFAIAAGYVAAGRVLGAWIAERDLQGFQWIQKSSSFSLMTAGLAALLLPFAAANVLHMAGDWIGFFRGMVTAVGVIATVAALMVGFGAVVLSRGGRRRAYADGVEFDFDLPNWSTSRPWRAAWEATEEFRTGRPAGSPEPEAPSASDEEGGDGMEAEDLHEDGQEMEAELNVELDVEAVEEDDDDERKSDA